MKLENHYTEYFSHYNNSNNLYMYQRYVMLNNNQRIENLSKSTIPTNVSNIIVFFSLLTTSYFKSCSEDDNILVKTRKKISAIDEYCKSFAYLEKTTDCKKFSVQYI